MHAWGTLTKRTVLVGVSACAVLFAGAFPRIGQASPARQTAPTLGGAASFAVLAYSTVTNTGLTVITGNLGVSPGTAVTGFPPGVVMPPGTIHSNDSAAVTAHSDATTAYNNLAGQPCTAHLSGQDLGGLTLTPGVYCFDSSAQLTGTLTLNGEGNPNAVFIFKIGSTLTTASASSVVLINGASSCNVFFQVGSSATLGKMTKFAGSILALTSITLDTAAQINGRALALNGAVTLDSNIISNVCVQSPTATATGGTITTTATTIPTPAATSIPATATAIAATATAGAAATNTVVAVPTSTAIAGPTSTAIAAATSTAIAAATSTAVASTQTGATIVINGVVENVVISNSTFLCVEIGSERSTLTCYRLVNGVISGPISSIVVAAHASERATRLHRVGADRAF